MKLYCGRNREGIWKASLDESKMDKFSDAFESNIDVIHNNKVYMIKTYHGYNYSRGSIPEFMYDVETREEQLFNSLESARKSDTWKEKEKLAKDKPQRYHVTPFSIASDDFGKPFICGDCVFGKFNMEIIGVEVI